MMQQAVNDKKYLGDAVFVYRDLLSRLVIQTENGYEITNQIVLEPEVASALVAYIDIADDRVRVARQEVWDAAITGLKLARPMNGDFEHNRNVEPWKSVFDFYYKFLAALERARAAEGE